MDVCACMQVGATYSSLDPSGSFRLVGLPHDIADMATSSMLTDFAVRSSTWRYIEAWYE